MDTVTTSGRPPLPPSAPSLKSVPSVKENALTSKRSSVGSGTHVYDPIIVPSSQPQTTTVSNPPSIIVQLPPPHLSAPPVPPPSPPHTPRAPQQPSSVSTARAVQCCRSTLRTCVPKENIDTWDRLFLEGANADVAVCTDNGSIIDAHSGVLAASSHILRGMLDEQLGRAWPMSISLKGVHSHAARMFIRFLYSARYERADMEEYGLQLVVLAHAFSVPALKRVCTQHYEQGLLNCDNVVDLLQVARLCDAPRLHLVCMRLIVRDFKLVARSEGWRAMRESDPALEQELVEAVIEADTKKQDKLRKIEEDKVYEQLHDAMEALVHICRDGCRTIGPHDKVLDGKKQGTCKFPACKGLESLVRHFAGCKMKVSGGCVHCKRMWQLLELHSRMCLETSTCKVPLCRHFKERIGQQPSRKEETRWKLLVGKVMSAKGAASAFSLAAVSAKLEQVI